MTLAGIVAAQDLDCADRAKFRLVLPVPVPHDLGRHFAGARITLHAFSRFTPIARDLLTIVRTGAYRCDAIVGGTDIVATFEGDPLDWPYPAMADLARRLASAELGEVSYARGAAPACATCPARHCAHRREMVTAGR